jgi:anaerobic magnesium-protoporphyrin IX monomethyl ester cyclase
MKIALIHPPVPQSEDENLLGVYPPLGLLWLAGNIPNHQVHIYDLRYHPLHITDYDVVGITCQTVSVPNCAGIAEKIHQETPDTIIVTGGHHPIPQDLLPFSQYVVQGEGEITFRKLLHHIQGGPSCNSGIISKTITTPQRNPAHLSGLHPPNYDVEGFSLTNYHPNQGAMITSRGCPYNCLFCIAPFGHTWRGRTPSQVQADAEELTARGAPYLQIMDDLFTYDRERVFTICEKFKPLSVEWELPNGTRVDHIDHKMVTVMAASGCTRILYGIESGVTHVLKAIRKNITLEQIKHAIKTTRSAGINPEGLFMVGNPGDTPETIKKTVEFIKDLDITGHFSLATPYPGTDFWAWVKTHGTFLDVPYQDFEKVPVFETPDFSAYERLDMLHWASKECHP